MAGAARSVLALGVLMAAWPTVAHAQVPAMGDEPRIFSIQQRPYRLGHEFQLGLGVLPTNAFFIGLVLDASYTYHFSDFWAWEIANVGLARVGTVSLNFDTSLRDQLYKEYGVEPVGGGGERTHLIGMTSLVAKPLFGKLAVFNDDIVLSETFFSLGFGAVVKGDFARAALGLGMGLRFWSTSVLSFRFDIRDYLIFTSVVPENALMFALTASFNFWTGEREQEPTSRVAR